jgi:hypothetical protein
LHAARCMLHAARCMLHVARGMLHVACCMLHVACHVARCTLHEACCTLRNTRCTLHEACCVVHAARCTLQRIVEAPAPIELALLISAAFPPGSRLMVRTVASPCTPSALSLLTVDASCGRCRDAVRCARAPTWRTWRAAQARGSTTPSPTLKTRALCTPQCTRTHARAADACHLPRRCIHSMHAPARAGQPSHGVLTGRTRSHER